MSAAGCSSILHHPDPAPGGALDTTPSLRVEVRELRSATGCWLDYRLYSPASADDALVVVGHGFLRSKDHMDGLARRLAQAGLRVAAVNFCNSSLVAGRHRENGADMVAVARHLGARRVVYLGFSAGGLSAVIAGRTDLQTLGVVGLDLVDDAQGLGARFAAELDKPLIGFAGDPSPCNARDNGRAVYAAKRDAQWVRVRGAGHCEFETPSDWLCERVCGGPPPNAEALRQAITEATVNAVLGLTRPGAALAGTRPGGLREVGAPAAPSTPPRSGSQDAF